MDVLYHNDLLRHVPGSSSQPHALALRRYTGMLYDALDVGSLRRAAAARARALLAVGSALFGLLRADDPVPAYRLSAASALPGRPTLAARWKPVLEPALAAIVADELVVDLRSGPYAALGRLLAGSRAEPSDAAGVAVVARRAGMAVERPTPSELVVVVPA